jgi:DNA modification methylase
MPEKSVDCCITSPPYFGLRDYKTDGQIGLENTIDTYISKLVEVFRNVRRVLKDTGTFWLVIGDNYAGGGRDAKHRRRQATNRGTKDMPKSTIPKGINRKETCGIPWRVAFALQADGWWLRQDIIWHKPNPMTESVADRCTRAHEYIFLMVKQADYYFNSEAIKEKAKPEHFKRYKTALWGPGTKEALGSGRRDRKANTGGVKPLYYMANKRSVWTVTTSNLKVKHFAIFPPALIKPMIMSGCPVGGIVLDPFMGTGTTAYVAQNALRKWIGIEINEASCTIAKERVCQRLII